MPWKVAAGVTCICHLVSAIASMLQLQPAVHVCVLYTPAMLVGHMNRVMVIEKDLTVDIGRARVHTKFPAIPTRTRKVMDSGSRVGRVYISWCLQFRYSRPDGLNCL